MAELTHLSDAWITALDEAAAGNEGLRVSTINTTLVLEYRVALDRGVTPTDSRRLRSGLNLETGTARVNSLRRLYDAPGFHYFEIAVTSVVSYTGGTTNFPCVS
mgnify:CR=1 FL=1